MMKNWKWSSDCPSIPCRGDPSNPSFNVANAAWNASAPCRRTDNETAEYAMPCSPDCLPGFAPYPNSAALTSTCSAFGNWSSLNGTCRQPVPGCMAPPPATLGAFGSWETNCSNARTNQTCNLLCWQPKPVEIAGESGWLVPQAVCNVFGEWQYLGDSCPNAPPPCTKSLPAVANGSWFFQGPFWVVEGAPRFGVPLPGETLYQRWYPGAPVPSTWLTQAGNNYTLSCGIDYRAVPNDTAATTITCLPDGTWSAPQSSCQPRPRCPGIPIALFFGCGSVDCSFYECRCRCSVDSSTRISYCQDGGNWGPLLRPDNTPAVCPAPPGRRLAAHEEDSAHAVSLKTPSSDTLVATQELEPGTSSSSEPIITAVHSVNFTHTRPAATPDETAGMRLLLMHGAQYEVPHTIADSRTVFLRPMFSYNGREMHVLPLRVFDTTWAGRTVEDVSACLAGALVHLDVGIDSPGLSVNALQHVEAAMQLPLVAQLRRLLEEGGVYTSAMTQPGSKYKLSTAAIKTDLKEHEHALVKAPRCLRVPAQLLELPRRILSELEPGNSSAWPKALRLTATVRSVVQPHQAGVCEGLAGSTLAVQPLLSVQEAGAAAQSGTRGLVWVFVASQNDPASSCVE